MLNTRAMDERAPRSRQQPARVQRLASLDRLNEMLLDPTLSRDRMLARMQDEAHLLRSEAALAMARGDATRSCQLNLIATEVLWLADTFLAAASRLG
jgi:hypothetical protein